MPTLRKLRPMRASVRLLIALSLLAAFASAIPARAADLVACGDTVITNVTLTEDLTCPGYGLVVGAHGITLDLEQGLLLSPNPPPRAVAEGRLAS